MSFLAQIDLETLPAIQLRRLLPEKGALAFFGAVSWSPPEDKPSGAVIYVAPKEACAAERPAPADLMPLYKGLQSYYFRWLDREPAPADQLRTFPRSEVEPVVMRSYADEHPFDEGVIGGRYQQMWEEAQRAAVIEAFGPPVQRYWPQLYGPGSRDIPPGYPLNLIKHGALWFPDDRWPYAGICIEIFAQLLRNALWSGGLGLQDADLVAAICDPPPGHTLDELARTWMMRAITHRFSALPAPVAVATLMRYKKADTQAIDWIARARALRFKSLSAEERQAFRSWCAAIGTTELFLDPSRQAHQDELFVSKLNNHTVDAFFHGMDQCLMHPEAAGVVPTHLLEVVRWRHSPVITQSLVGFTRHQLLGTGRTIQHAAIQFRDSHRLLAQFDSDSGINWMWGDMGALQYWISHADLAARRFDRVIMTGEGH